MQRVCLLCCFIIWLMVFGWCYWSFGLVFFLFFFRIVSLFWGVGVRSQSCRCLLCWRSCCLIMWMVVCGGKVLIFFMICMIGMLKICRCLWCFIFIMIQVGLRFLISIIQSRFNIFLIVWCLSCRRIFGGVFFGQRFFFLLSGGIILMFKREWQFEGWWEMGSWRL